MANFFSQLMFAFWDGNDWANLGGAIWTMIGRGFYYLVICGVGRISDICQLVFRKFAGISETGVQVQDGENIISSAETGGDVALTFIQSSLVKNLFLTLIILAVVLLLITTFVATLKTEFAKDGNNNKKKVIKNAFRGIANFLLVPLICFFALTVGNMLLRALDGATSNGSNVMLTRQIFMSGAYNANRARLSENNSGSSDNYSYKEGSFGNLLVGDNGTGSTGYGNFGIFVDDTSGTNQRRAADKIDSYFTNGYTLIVKQSVVSSLEYADSTGTVRANGDASKTYSSGISSSSESANTLAYSKTDFYNGGIFMQGCAIEYTNSDGAYTTVSARDGMITFAEGDKINFSIYNVGLVFYYYDLTFTGFNYLIGSIAVCFCAYTLIVTVLGLIKRIFMISTLFIISAPICALYPIDDGKALEAWRKEFIKQTLSAYTIVVVMNLFLSLLPLMSNVTVFLGSELGFVTDFANYIARILIVIGALTFFKDATKSIAGLIGANDALGDGAGGLKGFKAGVGRVVGGAAAVGGAVAGAAKLGGKFVGMGLSAAGNAMNFSARKDEKYKQDQLAKAEANKKAEIEGKAGNNANNINSDANSMNKAGKAENGTSNSGDNSNAMNKSTENDVVKPDKNANNPNYWHFQRKSAEIETKRNKALEELKNSSKYTNADEESKKQLEKSLQDKYNKKADKYSDASLNKKIDKDKKREKAVATIKSMPKKVKDFVKNNEVSKYVAGVYDSVTGVMKGDLKAKDAWQNQVASRNYRKKAKEDSAKAKEKEMRAKQDEMSKQSNELSKKANESLNDIARKMDAQNKRQEELIREMKDMKKDINENQNKNK